MINRKAFFNYEILEKLEAGIVLRGSEIKAIRAGKVNLTGAHARLMQKAISYQPSAVSRNRIKAESRKPKAESSPELFLINANIQTANTEDNTRTRKLLVHKKEINRLIGQTQQKGLSLVPLSIYLKKGLAKVELGLARGKKLYDKRETIKKRDLDRSKEY